MEPLSFVLGGAAVKWIVRLWTGETVFEGAEGDIVDAFSNRLSSGREKRALRRDLEALADKIAERLEPFISAEIRGIDEGELAAATLAAQTSLEVIGATRFARRHSHQHPRGAAQAAGRERRDSFAPL